MIIYEHEAQYYETDQMGIIHHSNYLRWFESARIQYLKEIGIDYGRCEEMGLISPVMEMHCTYKSMVRFGDTVQIYTRFQRYTGIKLYVTYEVRDKATGELRTLGESKHCFTDKTGKPIALQKNYPELHERFLQVMEADE
ncbi:MAG: acyl-CoA thioesterase [Bacteroides sp.]|nr:acyl-CoA thioesterase [Bacteroides sp.]MCM1549591.1 acyl-CoA thioesterase [Clostridium sp.]